MARALVDLKIHGKMLILLTVTSGYFVIKPFITNWKMRKVSGPKKTEKRIQLAETRSFLYKLCEERGQKVILRTNKASLQISHYKFQLKTWCQIQNRDSNKHKTLLSKKKRIQKNFFNFTLIFYIEIDSKRLQVQFR